MWSQACLFKRQNLALGHIVNKTCCQPFFTGWFGVGWHILGKGELARMLEVLVASFIT
jgi:hypothetical protein